MFENSGEKIRKYGEISFWVVFIASVICAALLGFNGAFIYGIIVLAIGLFVAFIDSLFIVAIGDMLVTMNKNASYTAEILRLLESKSVKAVDEQPKVIYVNAPTETICTEEKTVAATPIKKTHTKPEGRWVTEKSSNALKILDKAIKFNFKTDDECMKWVVRNIDMLSDDEKSKLEELVNCHDAYDFIEIMYKIYSNID